jgi:hypothetical protein
MRVRGGSLLFLFFGNAICSEWKGVREIDTTWWGCVLRGMEIARAMVGWGSEWNYLLWFGCLFRPPSISTAAWRSCDDKAALGRSGFIS